MNTTRPRDPHARDWAGAPPIITVASPDIPVRPYDTGEWTHVALADIRIVRPIDDWHCDVVYTVRRPLDSDLTADEVRSGQVDINQLLIALGWQPGMGHNEHMAHLTRFDA